MQQNYVEHRDCLDVPPNTLIKFIKCYLVHSFVLCTKLDMRTDSPPLQLFYKFLRSDKDS